MPRIAAYFILWNTGVGIALILRFSRFGGSDSDARFALALGVMLFTALLFATAGVYESRRLVPKVGRRGSGTFAYLRGWIKSVAPEFALDDSMIPGQVAREYRIFRLGSMYAIVSLLIVIPVLIF